jgi:hypothetical protein
MNKETKDFVEGQLQRFVGRIPRNEEDFLTDDFFYASHSILASICEALDIFEEGEDG